MNNLTKNGLIFLALLVLLGVGSSIQNKTENTAMQLGQITCFVYHRFGDERYPSTNISIKDFRKHLEYLKNNEYRVITLGQAVEFLNRGKPIPEKTVALSIDDGYQSFLENGMPLLREYGYKATLFINTNQFGSGDLLSEEEIRQLIKEGIEIQNHSHSHAYFVNLDPKELAEAFRNDLLKSQSIFLEKFGFKPNLYSYPYGEYTPDMQDILKKEGYVAAIAQKSGVISSFSDPYALPRFPVAGIFAGIDGFIRKLKMKSMPVQLLQPVNPLLQSTNNPPTLQLKVIDPRIINLNSIQCFIGGTMEDDFSFDAKTNILSIKARYPLNSRRTLYTITAQSAAISDEWHWVSFLWINNKIEE
ncbi:MAG: polysaccharide deacetylase family protein [Bacteroidales bacterium]|jgi:peptidoglycan/xylan/chitin deacetylase (PgdA/CDA1 family)|nr:polysaccharide deacetylase family protein [Bacteroidales bacterium]